MQMRLAHQADVLRSLKIDELQTKKPDVYASDVERVTRLENGLADQFEYRCGRTFGEANVSPETRFMIGADSDLLILPVSMQRIDSVQVAWGRAYPMQIVEPSSWYAWGTASDGGFVGILIPGASWADLHVEVTGIWSDQDVEGVPDDVREAMTRLTVKEYRRETSSEVEQVGPEGITTFTPSGWNDKTVTNAINRYRVHRRRVGV